MVKDLDAQKFAEKLAQHENDGTPVVEKNTILEFWEPWCPHCQAMIPRYEKVSEEYPAIDCYRVVFESVPEIAKFFGVTSFPTFIFLKAGGQMEKSIGEMPESELAHTVARVFGIVKG